MPSTRLSPTQAEILKFLADGHAPFLAYYPGDIGAEPRGAGYYWRQRDRREGAPKPPPVPGTAVAGLTRRNFLEYVSDNDYQITEAGRIVLRRYQESRHGG